MPSPQHSSISRFCCRLYNVQLCSRPIVHLKNCILWNLGLWINNVEEAQCSGRTIIIILSLTMTVDKISIESARDALRALTLRNASIWHKSVLIRKKISIPYLLFSDFKCWHTDDHSRVVLQAKQPARHVSLSGKPRMYSSLG